VDLDDGVITARHVRRADLFPRCEQTENSKIKELNIKYEAIGKRLSSAFGKRLSSTWWYLSLSAIFASVPAPDPLSSVIIWSQDY